MLQHYSMSEKYQNKYRIESARMKNYDYSKNGGYFVTIVTANREHFFGNITDDNKIELSNIGEIVNRIWEEIPNQFSFICLDEMIIMPNHIHGVLWIDNDHHHCGDAINRVYDCDSDCCHCKDAINRVSTEKTETKNKQSGGITGNKNPMFHENLSRVIRWFKGRCTFEINKINPKPKFAWQSRFHDRIIRNSNELKRIQYYIMMNPEKWNKKK